MPPLNLLNRPKWSRGRVLGMWALRGYLVVAVVLLLVKAIQLGINGKGYTDRDFAPRDPSQERWGAPSLPLLDPSTLTLAYRMAR